MSAVDRGPAALGSAGDAAGTVIPAPGTGPHRPPGGITIDAARTAAANAVTPIITTPSPHAIGWPPGLCYPPRRATVDGVSTGRVGGKNRPRHPPHILCHLDRKSTRLNSSH